MLGFGAKELLVAVFSLVTVATPFRVTTNGKFFPLRIEKYKANSFETVSCTKLPDSSVQSDNQVNSSDTNTSLSLQEESSELQEVESNEVLSADKAFDQKDSLEDIQAQSDKLLELDISSESQYMKTGNIFVAEGDVRVTVKNGIIKANYIEFDKDNNILTAKDNVVFERGSQYFQASFFKYDLTSQNGFIRDVYGVVRLKSLDQDLGLENKPSMIDNSTKIQQKVISKRYEPWGSMSLQRGGLSNSRLDPYGKNRFINKPINSWRLQSKCIVINKEGWKSNEISFTNDPISPSQNRYLAKEVIAQEDKDGILIVTSNKGSFILEEKLKIPAGSRTYSTKKSEKRRLIYAYDQKDRDGFYVGIQSEPVQLGDNYELTIQPQILLQRAFLSKTNSYADTDSSIISEKVKRTAYLSDLFGLEATLTGKVFDWDSELVADISTLNTERFFYGSRYSAKLKKKIEINGIEDIEANLFAAYRERSWNGSLGESDIYRSFGGFLEKTGGWIKGKTDFKYALGSGVGYYQAEKLDEVDLTSAAKLSLYSSLSAEYPLIPFKSSISSRAYSASSSVLPIKSGLFLHSFLEGANYYYDNGKNQASITIGAGPRLTFGNFKAPVLDFTSLSVIPAVTFKAGESPFKFDNATDLRKLSFTLNQRLIGPFVFNGAYDINIDSDSDQYGDVINAKLSVLIEKRSYGYGIFYDIQNQGGGIMFRLKGFDFSGPGEPFVKTPSNFNK